MDVLIVRKLRKRKVTPLSRYCLAIFQNQKVTTGILAQMQGTSGTQASSGRISRSFRSIWAAAL